MILCINSRLFLTVRITGDRDCFASKVPDGHNTGLFRDSQMFSKIQTLFAGLLIMGLLAAVPQQCAAQGKSPKRPKPKLSESTKKKTAVQPSPAPTNEKAPKTKPAPPEDSDPSESPSGEKQPTDKKKTGDPDAETDAAEASNDKRPDDDAEEMEEKESGVPSKAKPTAPQQPDESDLRRRIRALVQTAKGHYSRGAYQLAISDCRHATNLNSHHSPTWLLYGNAQLMLKKYTEARSGYVQSAAGTPIITDAHANLAWLLATCPDAAIRDGETALAHAEMAHKLALLQPGFALSALAAANAELGNWDAAVKYETKAIENLTGDARQAAQKRLALYNAKQPCRDGNKPLVEAIPAF